MQLVGMLDSPYVRRVAISLDTLGIPFEHLAVSVFDDFEEFHKINPVVKAPTLICADGEALMDSSIILQFINKMYSQNGSLWGADQYQCECRIVCLALAACDKSVQIIYERNLRPKESQYEPWMDRVKGQIVAALSELEAELRNSKPIVSGALNQATITAVVAWTFIQSTLANEIPTSQYPNLSELAEHIEQLAPFQKYRPIGPGVNG